eukprot:1183057-Prorocentrum_minimum.AAC.4
MLSASSLALPGLQLAGPTNALPHASHRRSFRLSAARGFGGDAPLTKVLLERKTLPHLRGWPRSVSAAASAGGDLGHRRAARDAGLRGHNAAGTAQAPTTLAIDSTGPPPPPL